MFPKPISPVMTSRPLSVSGEKSPSIGASSFEVPGDRDFFTVSPSATPSSPRSPQSPAEFAPAPITLRDIGHQLRTTADAVWGTLCAVWASVSATCRSLFAQLSERVNTTFRQAKNELAESPTLSDKDALLNDTDSVKDAPVSSPTMTPAEVHAAISKLAEEAFYVSGSVEGRDDENWEIGKTKFYAQMNAAK